MARSTLVSSLTAAVFPLAALLSCGGSQSDATPAPTPTAAPSPAVAAEIAAVPAGESGTPQLLTRPARPDRASPIPSGVDPKRPVATVNGRPIPAAKAYTVYRMNKDMLQKRGRVLSATDDQALRAQSLEVVVGDELLHQAAVAGGTKVAAAEVDAAFAQLKQRVGSEEAYKKFLAESEFTPAEVRKEIERNMVTQAYQKSLVAGKGVSEEQAKQFYEANAPKGMFKVPEQVHVQYILVKAAEKDPEPVRAEAKKRAEEAAKRAAAGEDFGALAKEYSQDPSAPRGGDVGLVPRGVMFPEFEAVAFSTKPGDVSPVFQTPKGFNVMKILEKKPESNRTFEEVKSALILDMGRLIEQDVVKAKVKELAAGAKLELLDPAFAVPTPPVPATKP